MEDSLKNHKLTLSQFDLLAMLLGLGNNLNQRELACSSEIEQLETQAQALELEMEQDIDETRRMIIAQTLRVVYRALLA